MFIMDANARREQHRQALRRAILDAARETFVREGYAGFSMRKLAARIGYSAGSLYLHFKSKQELFAHLRDESFSVLQRNLSQRLEKLQGDPVAALVQGLHAYVEFGLSNPDEYRIAFMVQPPVSKRPYLVHAPFHILRDIVHRCADQGRFRPVDVETTSQALWATVHGITSLLVQRPEFPWVDRQTLIDQVIGNAIGGLLIAERK